MTSSDKKKIVIFSQTIEEGGAERQAIYLARALEDVHQVYFVTFYKTTLQSTQNHSILKSLHVNHIELKGWALTKILDLYRLLKREQIDIIFSYLLLPNFLGGFVGRLAGVKYPIGGIRSSKITIGKVWMNKILQNYINKYTIYNNFSGYQRYGTKGFAISRTIMINNCIEFKQGLLERENNKLIRILSVGRFSEPKDYYTALLSIKTLYESVKNFRYYILGYGSLLPQINQWIIDLNLEKLVEVVINPANIDEYYKESDIYLMTSIFEGLPNTVLEAMSYSLPLVLTDAGDNGILAGNNNGFLCKIKDYKSIAKKLELLIQNQDLRNSFGFQSYQLVVNNYSFESFKQKYLTFIGTLK